MTHAQMFGPKLVVLEGVNLPAREPCSAPNRWTLLGGPPAGLPEAPHARQHSFLRLKPHTLA